MVMRGLLVVVMLATAARAESPKLASARAAIEAVRYDEAQQLLVDALREGGHGPAEVVEIYKLSASTAIVLDRQELAEQYYRRWLALDPAAALPRDVAPKIRAPFVKAQAYMNAHGRLVAKVSPERVVVVEADPLGMAAAASAGGAPVKLDAERRAQLAGPGTVIAILDEYGNRLVELAVPQAHVVTVARTDAPRAPFYRRGRTWLVATAVVTTGGLVAGYLANRADDEAQRYAASSSMHAFTDYAAAIDRRDRDAQIANGLFLAGGVLAAATVVAYLTEPDVAPVVTRDTVGVAVRW